jgi:hypothetical protein
VGTSSLLPRPRTRSGSKPPAVGLPSSPLTRNGGPRRSAGLRPRSCPARFPSDGTPASANFRQGHGDEWRPPFIRTGLLNDSFSGLAPYQRFLIVDSRTLEPNTRQTQSREVTRARRQTGRRPRALGALRRPLCRSRVSRQVPREQAIPEQFGDLGPSPAERPHEHRDGDWLHGGCVVKPPISERGVDGFRSSQYQRSNLVPSRR